ncbi:MAG: hypothetical protein AB1649_06665 [Chloroflexota bacterium]
MKRFSLKYILLTSRFDQLWFPFAFWALFIIIGIMRGPEYILDTARAYLGAVVPLVGGIMAAYAVLEDPSLELRFATPISAAQTLLERLVPTFVVQSCFALTYQVFAMTLNVDISMFGNWAAVQLIWLVPTFSLMALGCLSALAAAQTTTGALLTGMVWLVQLVARGWFAGDKIGQYFLVFMSPLMPDHPALRSNQLMLVIFSIALFLLGWRLLHRQERYI